MRNPRNGSDGLSRSEPGSRVVVLIGLAWGLRANALEVALAIWLCSP